MSKTYGEAQLLVHLLRISAKAAVHLIALLTVLWLNATNLPTSLIGAATPNGGNARPRPLAQLRSTDIGSVPKGVPSKDPAEIFDGEGSFDAKAYVQAAAAYGTASMISERFGSPWTAYHRVIKAPTWSQAASIYYKNLAHVGQWFYYSRGTPQTEAGDYSSSYAQVAYVYNSSVSDSVPGVDGIQTLIQAHGVWGGQPQLYWAVSYGHAGHPTVTLCTACGSSDPYGVPQQPVAVTRAYGASEAAGCSYMVFQNGQVACGEGGNTAQDFYYFKPFPTSFTPTAASVTNNGEFLLVTGWNTATYQGQLAVIAIGSSQPYGTFWYYEWAETYPGFRNYSLPSFSKLLGIIDLPGMTAPTAVEAVGNWVHNGNAWLPGQLQPGQFPLSVQLNWSCFAIDRKRPCSQSNTGGASLYDTGGFALVASRYERKVLLMDLTPLFDAVRKGMFSNWSQFRANVANTGTGAGQWPLTLAELPSETPTIVKTMKFSAEVTAISASLYADNLAFIATDDGTLRVWNTDGLQTGTGTRGRNASQIYALPIGNNTTRIAHMKHWYWASSRSGAVPNRSNDPVRYQYILVSRGDKTITWIDMSSGTPIVVRTLSDSRLVDPLSAEDNNNHGTQSDLIDIADYGASDVKGYRYGPVIEWTEPGTPEYGMGPNGTDPFEYEGAYATPTGPFEISGENVP